MNRSIRQRGLQLIGKAEGCFVGLAVGEALGGPLEDSSVDEIRARYGLVDEMLGGGRWNLRPGETRDETALAENAADSIVVCGEFDPDDMAARLAEWQVADGRGADTQTSTVLSMVAAGGDWEQASLEYQASLPERASKGSLLRSTPLALLCFNDREDIVRTSRLCCRITHPHADCQWASVLVNLTIGELLTGREKFDALGRALNVYNSYENASKNVVERALSAVNHCSHKPHSGSHVLDVLECSLWAWLHHDSYEESLVAAVNLGGESDTVGALTGAFSGSTYGIDSIPKRWLIYVRNRERLQELADTVTGICQVMT